MNHSVPLVRREHERRLIEVPLLGLSIYVLVSTDESGGAQCVTEFVIPDGYEGPAPHWHDVYSETFIGLEGRFALHIGDVVHHLGPNDVGFVPPRQAHTYSVPAGAPVRFLLITAPGGDFDGYLAAVAEYVVETGQRPVADHEPFRALQAKFDTYDASIPVV
jgi:mannose-6-phosphate isomerase-like protein (cupin superfamily)